MRKGNNRRFEVKAGEEMTEAEAGMTWGHWVWDAGSLEELGKTRKVIFS